jgi:hypothetical protein
MLNQSENRSDLIKGILAGGLVLIGLATGSNPLFVLLISTSVNVGGNLLANLAENSFENWRKSWFSPEGFLNDPIRNALRQSFVYAVRQLEIDWKKTTDYHYLIYKKQHERAKLSLILLNELNNDSTKILEGAVNLAESLRQENIVKLFEENKLDKGRALSQLNQTLEKYLGAVESLSEFAKMHLAEKWLFRFSEILQSEKGTPAWRAYQHLWQSQLLKSTTQISQLTSHNQDTIAELQQDVKKISAWLEDWGKVAETGPKGKYDEIVLKSFDEIIKQDLEVYNDKLDSIKADTQLLINFLNEKFIGLDFDKIMLNFLQKEILNDQYVNLKQAGHSSEDEDVSLGRVFVDLPVSNERSIDPPNEKDSDKGLPSGFVTQILKAAEEHLDPETLNLMSDQSQTEQISLPSKFKRGRFVVIGGPGQGKTTLSQFVCQLFRAAILDKKLDVHYERVLATLSEIKTFCSEEKIQLPSIPRFPFRITLSDFAAKLASSPSINSLFSYIVDRIRARTNQEITVDHLRQWFAEYPWIIILDGLDEVPASSNRDAVLSAIDNFWIDATGCNADILVIATTRPQGFNDDFAPNIYQHKWLVPLSAKEAMHYAHRLVGVRYSKDQDRMKKIIERLQSALNEEATARLMRSPLQVTIMTALVDRIGKPPQERWSLFQRYYTVIYHRETERDIPAASILRNYEPDINAIHYRVGLLLQIESEFSGRTGVRLSHDRFSALVQARLEEEGHEGKELEELKRRIMEAATDRLVFLVGIEANEIGFEIRSLQEFMAAEALMGTSDTLLLKRLRQIAPLINWRNVFLFAAGKCFAVEDRQHLRETIHGICAELNESENLEDEVLHVTLAGSQLALDLLEDGPAIQRQPKYAKSLARLACRLWKLPPNKNHSRLADLYEDQLEDVYAQELESHLSSARTRQGAWQSLILLANKHISWAENLIKTYWPKEEGELLEIFKISTNAGMTNWALEKFSDLLLRLEPLELFITLQEPAFFSKEWKPEWLTSFLDLRSGARVALRLSDDEKIDAAFNIVMLGHEKKELMRGFAELSNPVPAWIPLISASRLLENPTKKILASEIRNIAEHFSITSHGLITSRLPWMLRAFLETTKSQDELHQFADRVENGEFGDTEDWMAAETRWLNQGVIAQDLDYMTNDHWPFDKNIGRIGFPIAKFNISDAMIFGKSLLDLYGKYSGSKLGSDLAEMLTWAIYFEMSEARHSLMIEHKRQKKQTILNSITSDQLMMIIREIDKDVRIPISLSMFVAKEVQNIEEYLSFFDYFGRERRFALLLANPEVEKEAIRLIADAFTRNPNQLGLLRVLSEYAQSGISFHIPPHLLRPENYSERSFQEAVLIIRLAQQDWNQTERKTLARYTIEFAEDQPEIIDQVIRTIGQNNIVGLALEAYLLDVLDKMPSLDWSKKTEILGVLENSLRHRTSQLTEVWEELGLPASLKKLIQT